MVDYTYKDIIEALIKIGLKERDTVFVHSNLGFFGRLENAKTAEDLCEAFYNAFKEVLGDEGTLMVPTFSYSFCNNVDFDLNNTKGVCGIFSEYIRKLPFSMRSCDPNFSVAGFGKMASYLTVNMPAHSYGDNSFFDRFCKINGKICNLNFDANSSIIHYIEKKLQVPYRFDKEFSGKIIINGKSEVKSFYHFCRNLSDNPDFKKFHSLAVNKNILKQSKLGKGMIVCLTAKDTVEVIENKLSTEPRFLMEN